MRKPSISNKSTNTPSNNVSSTNKSVSKILVKPNPFKSNKFSPYESIATILVNVLLSMAAIAGLVKLIPDQSVQVSKLHDLDQEVATMQKTVNCLKDDFSQSFDLGSSQTASLRAKGLVSSTQRPIRFADASNSPKSVISNSSCN